MSRVLSVYFTNFNIAFRRAKAHNALDRARRADTKCHWDDVEELFEELSEYKKSVKKDPMEIFCQEHPSDLECRIYDS